MGNSFFLQLAPDVLTKAYSITPLLANSKLVTQSLEKESNNFNEHINDTTEPLASLYQSNEKFWLSDVYSKGTAQLYNSKYHLHLIGLGIGHEMTSLYIVLSY